jgi:hypothetical protein
MTQYVEARRVHTHASNATIHARTGLGACIERATAARQELQGLTTAASIAKMDAQKFKPQVIADARAMLLADKDLKQRRHACIQLAATAAQANTAKQFAVESLEKAQASDAVTRKARATSGKRPALKLPIQPVVSIEPPTDPAVVIQPEAPVVPAAPVLPPPSPPTQETPKDKRKTPPCSPDATPAKKTKVKYVTKPKI